MAEQQRKPLSADLVAQMAVAAGRPVAAEDLVEVTGLIETKLVRFDVSGVEPEFKWDARWEKAE